MARIGIFGGSFNPPHWGHVQAVVAAREALALDQVFLVPAANPPHKQMPAHTPDAQLRLLLTRLAVADLEWAEVLDIELRREGPSYTVDTLRQLRDVYPEDELFLILGTDMFLSLHRWYQAAQICQMAQIVFAARTDRNEEDISAQKQRLEREFGTKVHILANEVLELSSTEVRQMLAFGCAGSLLPPKVSAAVKDLNLYSKPADYRRLSLEDLAQAIVPLHKKRRIPHVLGCRETAVALARQNSVDETLAARAALLHDVTKALDTPMQLQLCADYGMMDAQIKAMQPQLLHALTGSLVADRVFGECAEVCEAIRWHTTGHPGMTTLEKVIFTADIIEPSRDYPGVEKKAQSRF